jgi:hypothetical protein
MDQPLTLHQLCRALAAHAAATSLAHTVREVCCSSYSPTRTELVNTLALEFEAVAREGEP